MGVFNNVIHADICPWCDKPAKMIFQIHTACSVDGDERGRFCLEDFLVGENLPWFPKGHKLFDEWKDVSSDCEIDEGSMTSRETCFGSCADCKQDLLAIVTIVNFRIEGIESIRRDD